jgi:hypothetical protein
MINIKVNHQLQEQDMVQLYMMIKCMCLVEKTQWEIQTLFINLIFKTLNGSQFKIIKVNYQHQDHIFHLV